MATEVRVGGEVEAFCNKCKLTLAHTILAMVGAKVARVECNTCHGAHAYRGKAAPKPRASKAAAAPSRQSVTFEQLLAGRDRSSAQPYMPKDTYAKDALMAHPTFGHGVVLNVRSDKVDVFFEKGFEKTLIHARGTGHVDHPHFEHPKPHQMAATDKPLAAQETSEIVEEEEEEEEEDEPRPHPRPA